MKKYQIIYADPAWSYNDKMETHSFSELNHYQGMPLEDICALDVGGVAEKNSVLFMWAVSPLLPESLEVIKAWGFKFKTIAFVWSKKYKNGTPVVNLGRWTMGNVEICLLATKGQPKRIKNNVRQLVEELRLEHSRKPDEVRKRIVELMGDLPRIELFARDRGDKDLWGVNRMDGWDTWGNEVKCDIEL